MLIEGTIIGAATMCAFYFGLKHEGPALASTMAFATLSLARLFHGFNCRSVRPVWSVGLFKNKYLWFALIAGMILLTAVLTISPIQSVFEVRQTVITQLGIIFGFALIPLVVIQGLKFILTQINK